MTDDIHPDATDSRPDDQRHAREACEHALDALHGGDLSRATRCSMKRMQPSSAPRTTAQSKPTARLPTTDSMRIPLKSLECEARQGVQRSTRSTR